MSAPSDLGEAASRLAHNATFVGLLPALLIGLVVGVVQPLAGVVVAVVAGAGWVLAVRARIASAVDRALDGLAVQPLEPGSAPRLENLVDGLRATSGVAEPELAVVDSEGINALVVASQGRARLVVTSGLVAALDRLESEGVVANLLARVRDGSAGYLTLVVALLGTSRLATRELERHLGDQWVVRSDLAAVDLTRYPPGLRSALDRMAAVGTAVPGAPSRTAPLWMAPAGVEPSAEVLSSEPLALRIAVLAEL